MGLLDRFFGPPSEEKFARILTDALRRAGDDRQATYDKDESRLLHTKDGKDAGITNLRNLYTEYCNAPKNERNAMLARVCKALLNPMEMPEDFEDVKPDLLPTVRTRSMLELLRLDAEIAGGSPMDLPSLPLTDHLVICLVYDMPAAMKFVSQHNLVTWGVSLSEALEVARHNLAQLPFKMFSIGDHLFVMESADAYDGSRVLMTDMIRALKFSGQPIALPITRDTLMMTGSEDIDGLRMMSELAGKKNEAPRPLCPILMRLSGDEWETWQLPVNHALHEKFKELELMYFSRDYAELQKLQEKRNEQLGIDVFVASFSVVKRNEKLMSYAVWSKTVPTWLPKTDYVALFDPETKKQHFIPWQSIQEKVGRLLQPLDCYPPRYFANEFPTEEEISQMEDGDLSA